MSKRLSKIGRREDFELETRDAEGKEVVEKICLIEMTGLDRDEYVDFQTSRAEVAEGNKLKITKSMGWKANLLQRTLHHVGDDGKLTKFTEKEIQALPMQTIDDLFDAANEICFPDAMERRKKKAEQNGEVPPEGMEDGEESEGNS